MGLDGVELIMAIEEEFNIEIPNEEAERIRTAGDLCELAIRLMNPGTAPQGQTGGTVRAFNSVRHALMVALDMPRTEVTADLYLDRLFPLRSRRALWQAASAASEFAFPELVCPRWLVQSLTYGVGALCLLALLIPLMAFRGHSPMLRFLALGAIGVPLIGFLSALAYRVSRPWARLFPFGIVTVGDLTHYVARRYRLDPLFPATQDQVWQRVQEIIVQQLGVRPEQVTWDADLVRDLGIG